jgi:hypothetical protein
MAAWRLITLQAAALVLLAVGLISCGGMAGTTDQSAAGNSAQRAALYANVETWTAQVRAMAQGSSLIPIPGTLLAIEVAKGGGPGYATCSDFSAVLSEVLSTNTVMNRVRSIVLDTDETHAVVEYYDPYLSRWNVADPTFGLVYFDDATQVGQSVADLSALVQAQSFDEIHEKFVTPYQDSLLVNFIVDPVTMFLNPIPPGQWMPNPINDPRPLMQEHSLADVEGVPGTYAFEFANAGDSWTLEINQWGTFSPQTTSPDSKWLLSGGLQLQAEWYSVSQPAPVDVYSFPLFSIPNSALVTPADGITDIDPAVPVQLTWRPVAKAQAYQISVGTSPGGSDVASSGNTQATQFSVSLGTQQTYYVRLQTEYENNWEYRDSSFQTGTGLAHLISPANGATDVDASSPVQFSWNSVSDEEGYGLSLGSVPGGSDLYQNMPIQDTSISVTLAPGSLYYARVLTQKSGYWYYSDSKFTTAP